MGEAAEMMLDGTCCEGCGDYLGEGDGFPRYCSRECARGRGADGPIAGQSARPRPPHFSRNKEPRALQGDWSVLARFVADGRANRREARQGLEWSKRKVGGIIASMEAAGLMATGGSEFWMTERGLQAMRATR